MLVYNQSLSSMSPKNGLLENLIKRLDDGACTLRRVRDEVDGLAAYINYNSAHGHFMGQKRLNKELQGLRDNLRSWEADYNDTLIQIVK